MTPRSRFAILIGANQLRSELMPDESQILQTIQTLMVKLSAVRDVTICLLAAQARTYSDQTALFREISEGLDKRLAQTIPQTASQQIAAMGEQLRVEIDLIIGSAQRALGHGTN